MAGARKKGKGKNEKCEECVVKDAMILELEEKIKKLEEENQKLDEVKLKEKEEEPNEENVENKIEELFSRVEKLESLHGIYRSPAQIYKYKGNEKDVSTVLEI